MSQNGSNQYRVGLVVQPSASHYRAPLIEQLMESDSINFNLLGHLGSANRADAVKNAPPAIAKHVRPIGKIHLIGPLCWDTGVVGYAATESYDALVVEGNIYALSSWVAAIVARLRKRKVLLWGHGWKRRDSGLKQCTRKLFYRLPHGHLVYGKFAVQMAAEIGLTPAHFFPVFNSIYPTEVLKNLNTGKKLDLLSAKEHHFVFSGRLTKRHGVEHAIRAILQARRLGYSFVLHVVGDGPEKPYLASLAEEDPNSTIFHGSMYSLAALKEIYDKAVFAISPGASGLNVIQALGFQTPVIAAFGDPQSGPEIEALDFCKHIGFSHAEPELLTEKLISATKLQRDEYERLSLVGFNIVLSNYTTEAHSKNIIAGILNTLKQKPEKS